MMPCASVNWTRAKNIALCFRMRRSSSRSSGQILCKFPSQKYLELPLCSYQRQIDSKRHLKTQNKLQVNLSDFSCAFEIKTRAHHSNLLLHSLRRERITNFHRVWLKLAIWFFSELNADRVKTSADIRVRKEKWSAKTWNWATEFCGRSSLRYLYWVSINVPRPSKQLIRREIR